MSFCTLSRAVSTLKTAVGRLRRRVQVIFAEIQIQLLDCNPFDDLSNKGQIGYWPIIGQNIVIQCRFLEQWYDTCILKRSWK